MIKKYLKGIFLGSLIAVGLASATGNSTNYDLRCVPDFNLPDQWITTYVGPQTPLYTRTFKFLDIVDDYKYDVKNNQTYYVWCMDQNMPVATGYLHSVWLYNLDEDLPDTMVDVPKGHITVEDLFRKNYLGDYIEFDKILYVINHRDGYGKPEVQEAIWYYSMGADQFTPHSNLYLNLVNEAETYGDDYIPPPGGKWILFAYTIVKEDTPHYPAGTIAQPFLMEIDIPECTNTKSQGYWKNHPDSWPVDSLVLGNRTYSKDELLSLLKKKKYKKSDASIILAKQLIAAKLNVLNGANASDEVLDAIDQADQLIADNCSKLPCKVKPSCPLGQEMIALAQILEEFNTSENDYCKCYYGIDDGNQNGNGNYNDNDNDNDNENMNSNNNANNNCNDNGNDNANDNDNDNDNGNYNGNSNDNDNDNINDNNNYNGNSNGNYNGNYNDNSNDNDNDNGNYNGNDNDNYNDNSNDNDNDNDNDNGNYNGNDNDNDNDNENMNSNCNSDD